MTILNKKSLTETDIRSKYITPAILDAGWNMHNQILEEFYFTSGEIVVNGKKTKRKEGKKADYLLFYKSKLPIAIIEAKDNNHLISDGMQQAIEYGQILDIPFIFTSNGDGFCFNNLLTGKEEYLGLNQFPSPYTLWQMYKQLKKIDVKEEEIILQDYYTGSGVNSPRYYQQVAVNRTIEAVSKDQKRILLVMATGTGKTATAFQIIHRLWKANKSKRILFLADRTSLITQTKNGDFKHFGDKMTKLDWNNYDKGGKSYEIYLALYQGITNHDDDRKLYTKFSPDFFDLIVIDECHRGSAKEDSNWREILTYFGSATQIGLTATPRETKHISNSEYFGEPLYTYSLKQGIEDGFLAPYKVFRITTNVDFEGYRPEDGKRDIEGNEVEDKLYETSDFDRNLVIKERVESVAKAVTEFLADFDPMAKTIIFCVGKDHAERMRQALVNLNSERVVLNSKYIMKITSDDILGKDQIENFSNPESDYPVIATTVDLLSTGVDTKTCKVIVLDANINSMTKFKQIIGRGTRVEEDYGKMYFNILDFRKVTDKFADPDFDGQAVRVKEFGAGEPIVDDDDNQNEEGQESMVETAKTTLEMPLLDDEAKTKNVTIIQGVDVSILFQREVQYSVGGKVVTKSLKDYTKEVLLAKYVSMANFLNLWKGQDRQEIILNELRDAKVDISDLEKMNDGDVDIFDTLCYIAFDTPLTKRDNRARIGKEKLTHLQKYSPIALQILNQLIDKYADSGIIEILTPDVLKLDPIKSQYSPTEVINIFGGMDKYKEAIHELVNLIY